MRWYHTISAFEPVWLITLKVMTCPANSAIWCCVTHNSVVALQPNGPRNSDNDEMIEQPIKTHRRKPSFRDDTQQSFFVRYIHCVARSLFKMNWCWLPQFHFWILFSHNLEVMLESWPTGVHRVICEFLVHLLPRTFPWGCFWIPTAFHSRPSTLATLGPICTGNLELILPPPSCGIALFCFSVITVRSQFTGAWIKIGCDAKAPAIDWIERDADIRW